MVPVPGNSCLKPARKDKFSMERKEKNAEFISGVVEGFYGRPWTFDQRKELFSRLKKLGLNFYLYAPKDDIKHRALWREMYTSEELDNLRSLITCAREQNVVFIYALSPGMDMVFSSSKEVDILKNKIKQIADLGCIAFALLYDDIDPEIRPADKHAFDSFAHAQVSVTNEVFKFLNKPKYFLVCPTAVDLTLQSLYCTYCALTCHRQGKSEQHCGKYAASRAVPTVDKSSYLSTLGNKLHPSIDIMWTGPKVVSKVISPHSIRVVANVLKRKPIIWDNIHANDYDQRRLFLGPYDGRPIHLYTHLRGILTNPNCEFESNFIAIHTLSTWIKCAYVTFYGEEEPKANKDVIEPMEDEPVGDSNLNENQSESKDLDVDSKEEKIDSTMETDTDTEQATTTPEVHEPILPKSIAILKAYDPEEALRFAVTEWLQEFSNPKSVIFNTYAKSGTFSVVNNSTPVQSTASLPSQTDVTSAVLKDSVKVVSTPSPVKAAKEKSRNKIKKNMEAEHGPTTDACVGEEMEVVETKTEEVKNEDVSKHKRELPFRLTVDDLLLLVDFFYLPHQHGKRAVQILKEFKWLKANSIKSDELSDTESAKKVGEWKERAKQFHGYVENVSQMFIRLSDAPNRAVLYDLYPYIWDVKEVVLLLDSFVNWLDSKTKKRKEKSFIPDDPEPWVIRGGICGEMQRLLPMLEGGSDLFTQGAPQVPTSSVYTIRPFTVADKDELYEICLSTCDDGQDGHDLFPNEPNMAGDRFIGPYMSICPETVFVVEDKFGLCGYGVAAADGRNFYDQYKDEWLPKMCEKYSKPSGDPSEFLYSEQIAESFHNPSIFLPDQLYNKYPAHVRLDLLSRAHSLGIGKRLLACILSVLKSEGCRGVYVEVASTNRDAVDFYSRLGFADVPSLKNIPEDIVVLGRTI